MRAETGDCPSCLRQHAEQRAAQAVPSIQIAHSVVDMCYYCLPASFPQGSHLLASLRVWFVHSVSILEVWNGPQAALKAQT